MLAAAKIPALLLIFTAKSHDSREKQTWGGGVEGAQTDSKSSGEEGKKTLCWRQREQEGGGKKRGIESVPF